MSESSAVMPQEKGEATSAPVSLSTSLVIKGLVAMNVILALTIAVMAVGYNALLPLKTIEPHFIALDKDSDEFVYEMLPIDTVEGREGLAQYFVRQYITLRHTKDSVQSDRRAKTLIAMSSPQIWDELKAIVQDPENVIYSNPDIKRKVEILRDSSLPQNSGYYARDVDFITIDTSDAQPGEEVKTEWNVKMLYEFAPQKFRKEEDGTILNPSGLRVVEYTLTKRRDI